MSVPLRGYYWAFEVGDSVDADWMLVFVELDGSVWYGSTKFQQSDFKDWIKAIFEKPEKTHE